MIIKTEKNETIKTTEAPRWSEYHKRFYAWGYRWIKTKKHWSSNQLLHNFTSFTETEEPTT